MSEELERRAREFLAGTYEYTSPRRKSILAGADLDRSERRVIRAVTAALTDPTPCDPTADDAV